jgi:uncharacterized protein (TIRG00374 family)
MQRWFLILLKVAISVLILVLLLRQFDIHAMIHGLTTISYYAIFAAVVAVLVQSVALAGRLVVIVGRFGPRFRLSDSYRLTLESMFFNQTFISFLGGDAFRIWRIRGLGLTVPKATAAILLDRLIGTLVNHIFLLAALPWLLRNNVDGPVKITLIILAIGGIVGLGFVLLLGWMRQRKHLLARLPARIRASRITAAIVEASTVGHYLLERPRGFGWAFVLSAVVAIMNVLVFAFILMGMGVGYTLAFGCALLVPAIMEIAMLPISVAGWGVREGAAIVAFGALGLPPDQALGASIAFGLIVAAVSISGGLLWLVDSRQISRRSVDVRDGSTMPP